MELEGDVQGRQDQAQKIIEMTPTEIGKLSTSVKSSHHLLRWSPCMGRKSQAFLASISN